MSAPPSDRVAAVPVAGAAIAARGPWRVGPDAAVSGHRGADGQPNCHRLVPVSQAGTATLPMALLRRSVRAMLAVSMVYSSPVWPQDPDRRTVGGAP